MNYPNPRKPRTIYWLAAEMKTTETVLLGRVRWPQAARHELETASACCTEHDPYFVVVDLRCTVSCLPGCADHLDRTCRYFSLQAEVLCRVCSILFVPDTSKSLRTALILSLTCDTVDLTILGQFYSENAAICTVQGRRPYMEDTFCALPKFAPSADYYGVFDGHGGGRASKYLAEHLHRHIAQEPNLETNPAESIRNAFTRVDADFLAFANRFRWDDGSTAVVAIVSDKRLCVANCGDSRAVICSAGKATPLSVDHKPDRDEEKNRIESLGGMVTHFGIW